MPASEADDLVGRGGRWGGQCEVVELGGMTPASGGAVLGRLDDGVTAVSEALGGHSGPGVVGAWR